MQADGGKLPKQSADGGLTPYVNFGVRIFRINFAKKALNRPLCRVLAGVNIIVAEQHRHKCPATIQTFSNAGTDLLGLIRFTCRRCLGVDARFDRRWRDEKTFDLCRTCRVESEAAGLDLVAGARRENQAVSRASRYPVDNSIDSTVRSCDRERNIGSGNWDPKIVYFSPNHFSQYCNGRLWAELAEFDGRYVEEALKHFCWSEGVSRPHLHKLPSSARFARPGAPRQGSLRGHLHPQRFRPFIRHGLC